MGEKALMSRKPTAEHLPDLKHRIIQQSVTIFPHPYVIPHAAKNNALSNVWKWRVMSRPTGKDIMSSCAEHDDGLNDIFRAQCRNTPSFQGLSRVG